jgi:predicted tellurium resistance membrane protein TerC
VWELDRALEDDTRAASMFAWLGAAGVVTWLASIVLADSLLPITSITALGAIVFGVVGWRASKHGDPREATNFVAVTLAVVLAVLWLFLLGALLLRLG